MGIRARAMGTMADTTTRGMGVGPVPRPAVRQQAARLLDARLLGGVALVVVSTLVGAWVLGNDEETVAVLRATRDLSVGAVVADTEVVRVPRTLVVDGYLGPGDDLGAVLRRPISAGELIPHSAVASAGRAPTREVTVAVDPLHAPPALLPGAAVDVWASADADSPSPPRLVLGAVVVAAVAADDGGLSGELGVVLDVPVEHVAEMVSATRGGAVDLVAVPLDSQQSLDSSSADVSAAGEQP